MPPELLDLVAIGVAIGLLLVAVNKLGRFPKKDCPICNIHKLLHDR